MGDWKRVEPTTVDKIGHRSIITKLFTLPNGQTHDFQTVSTEGTEFAGCIALTADKQVVIARQFRPGPEKIMDEIPGGGVESGEDPAAAAARELEEETGYRAGTVQPLGFAYKDAYNNAIWHFFLATDCVLTGKGQNVDETESIETKLISIDRLFENARLGRMTDVEAVFLAYEKLQELNHGPTGS